MIAQALKKDIWFYPTVFTVWALFMLLRHSGYSFLGVPLPSVSSDPRYSSAFQGKKLIDKSIEELKKSYAEESDITERGHIQHNIGTAYYDLYRSNHSRETLDSVAYYYKESIAKVPNVARFYYNLGRIYTEYRDHLQAKIYYEKALELKPDHILALHNLALLNYFELKLPAPAKDLLTRALSIRKDLPICNYVLGEIALQEKDYSAARDYFTQEVNIFMLGNGKEKGVPVSSSATRYAAMKSHYRLAILHSTKFVDSKVAQANLHAYLRLETNEEAKKKVIKEIQRYWVIKDGKVKG